MQFRVHLPILCASAAFVFAASACAHDASEVVAAAEADAKAAAATTAASAIPRSPAPAGARAYIISPTDGATVASPVTVRFGLEGMGVAPAGVQRPKTGHHHLIIDADTPAAGLPIPADDRHKHFGGGQTQVRIELAPGEHTLQLVLGDYIHVPHDPPVVSERVRITVTE